MSASIRIDKPGVEVTRFHQSQKLFCPLLKLPFLDTLYQCLILKCDFYLLSRGLAAVPRGRASSYHFVPEIEEKLTHGALFVKQIMPRVLRRS